MHNALRLGGGLDPDRDDIVDDHGYRPTLAELLSDDHPLTIVAPCVTCGGPGGYVDTCGGPCICDGCWTEPRTPEPCPACLGTKEELDGSPCLACADDVGAAVTFTVRDTIPCPAPFTEVA